MFFCFFVLFFLRNAAVPPVAADPSSHCAHEPLSALITPGGPQGWRVPGGARESEVLTLCSSVLIATLEAPFIRRCALCYFQPPLHVSAGTIKKQWIGKKKANKKKIKKPSQRAASNKSEVPPAGVSPSPIRELRLTSPPQCLVNK